MILFEGALLPDEEQDNVLDKLWESCLKAVAGREDVAQRAIDACGRVAGKLQAGEYDAVLQPLLDKGVFTNEQLEEVKEFFNRENLQLKYDVELGRYKKEVESDISAGSRKSVEPLGILFHIAAGNAEGLPFYSVLEGILSGNVNILKLPSADDGVSVLILHELIKEEPSLAPYICVLDVPSTNFAVMKKLADMADAVVVWGGDEAVRMIRTYAAPETQVISWGHKLSFAYVTEEVLESEELRKELYALAHHMCQTRQVLCSSCQGLYVDSDRWETVKEVGRLYFDILREVSAGYPEEAIGIRGKNSIALYNAEMENWFGTKTIWKDKGVSVIADTENELELSYMFRNCWVKSLPEEDILGVLKKHRGHLQTVGLICSQERRSRLEKELVKAGVTRISHGGNMSVTIPGEAHDGEYPLRKYSKIVEYML